MGWLRGIYLGKPQVYILLALLALAGSAWNISAPSWIVALAPSIAPDRWGPLLSAYCLIVIGSHLVVHPAVALLRAATGPPEQQPAPNWLPVIAGSCESVLFATSFYINKPGYIAVWLGVKVAAGWKLWEPGRNRFEVFVTGNALCIGCAYIGARAIAAVLR
ncbi:MAG: hypothetical protein NTY77_04070 [Elusimicrobia bacterium]|nr:hypothetical protein [Elusimicrobiota bacterium]